MTSLFSEERRLDILSRSLARKMLYEDTVRLPVPVLAGISGVPEDKWKKVYPDNGEFLLDLLAPGFQIISSELKRLKKEERSFLDKFEQILRILYRVERPHPEMVLLFQEIYYEEDRSLADALDKLNEEMKQLLLSVLWEQARLEGIVSPKEEKGGLILFMMTELVAVFQNQMVKYCRNHLESRRDDVFLSEDEMILRYMKPLSDQLKGLMAV